MSEITIASVLVAMFAGLIYSAFFYVKKQTSAGEQFDPIKAISTIGVGAIVGVGLQLGGTPLDAVSIETQLVAYAGIIALVEAAVKAFGNKVFTTTKWYRQLGKAIAAEGTRIYTMSEESVQWLVGDLPFQLQNPVAEAVRAMEKEGAYIYAICAGNNIFLIERAQLVGHKKYFLSWTVFSSRVMYKKISSETLEACRKKGFIPEWNALT